MGWKGLSAAKTCEPISLLDPPTVAPSQQSSARRQTAPPVPGRRRNTPPRQCGNDVPCASGRTAKCAPCLKFAAAPSCSAPCSHASRMHTLRHVAVVMLCGGVIHRVYRRCRVGQHDNTDLPDVGAVCARRLSGLLYDRCCCYCCYCRHALGPSEAVSLHLGHRPARGTADHRLVRSTGARAVSQIPAPPISGASKLSS